MNQKFTLSHRDAMIIVARIQAELEKDRRGAAVAVADDHGELIALLRTDGCPLASINNAINKAFTAARERRESKAVGQSSQEKGWPMTNFGDLRYTAWGGGVPIFHEGQVVGGVGVSGLPEEDDMVLARLGAKVLSEQK
ncbi:MAG TPA: heme-binding protein [Aggregatilineales bacterium]|nr:heme-binding protein [Aggregatilineales bacterium]